MKIDERLFGKLQRNLLIGVCMILCFFAIISIFSGSTLSTGENDVFGDNSSKPQNATYNLSENNTQPSSDAAEESTYSHDLLPAIPQQISQFIMAAANHSTADTTTASTPTAPTANSNNNTPVSTTVPKTETHNTATAPPSSVPPTSAPEEDNNTPTTGVFPTNEPTEPSSSVEPSTSN